MTKILEAIHGMIWGIPALILILGVGVYYTWKTDFAQLRLFVPAFRLFVSKLRSRSQTEDGVSSFQALCTALAATVGTGNLVGVAGAICIGGPGAIFWMWICGIFGMMTKFAEVTLAVHYRVSKKGESLGGPMYMIASGMGEKWMPLAKLYAIFGIAATFGVGNATQINAVVSAVNAVVGMESVHRNLAYGLILSVLIGSMLLGGVGRIGRTAEKLIPFVSAAYILLCLGALAVNAKAVPRAIQAIVAGAFAPRSVTGGMVGSFFLSLRTGCSRGVFTNEAGMGTASIAHASATAVDPVEQGLMGIVEVFLDTIVICTFTALVILTSGIPVPYGCDIGGMVTTAAFAQVLGAWTGPFLAIALCCFAFATVLGWGLYGGRCAQFLFGQKAWGVFALLQTLAVIPGAVLKTQTLWLLAEILNGLMAIPNLIALAVLAPCFFRLVTEYKRKHGILNASGGYYADFHQCKPL